MVVGAGAILASTLTIEAFRLALNLDAGDLTVLRVGVAALAALVVFVGVLARSAAAVAGWFVGGVQAGAVHVGPRDRLDVSDDATPVYVVWVLLVLSGGAA